MSISPDQPADDAPETEAALSDLRDGLERAHEIVAEAKLAMRQLNDDDGETP